MGRAVPMMAAALSTYTAGLQQIVIVGETGADALERAAVVGYRPFAITLALTPERQQRLRDVCRWSPRWNPSTAQRPPTSAGALPAASRSRRSKRLNKRSAPHEHRNCRLQDYCRLQIADSLQIHFNLKIQSAI